MPRYEVQSKVQSSHMWRFWEFNLTGTTLIVRHGRCGQKGQSTTKRFPSQDSARRAYDKLIADKLTEGWWPAHPEKAERRDTKARSPGIKRLEAAARKARRIVIEFALGPEGGIVTAVLDARGFGPKFPVPTRIELSHSRPGEVLPGWRAQGLDVALADVRRRYPDAPPLLGKLKVKSWGCPLKARALSLLVTSVLTERFPSAEAASPKAALAAGISATRDARAEVVELLRGGPRGIKKWNALDENAHRLRGPYRKLSLAGASLVGVSFWHLDLRGSDLAGCRLTDAHLTGATLNGATLRDADLSGAACVATKFHSADLEGARLRGANCIDATFRGANLRDADLRGADLHKADFCGADLTGAKLANALVGAHNPGDPRGTRYDGRTVFPTGYRLGPEWYRGGRGRKS